MTMLAAVKTGTDLIISADSKVSIKGRGGKDQKGELIWLDQTYDYANKIAFSVDNFWTFAVAGSGNIGEIQIKDIVEQYKCKVAHNTRHEQDQDLTELINYIRDVRASYFNSLDLNEDKWWVLDMFAFSSDAEGRGVRCWGITFQKKEPSIQEILKLQTFF
jgi:hypothetical protein